MLRYKMLAALALSVPLLSLLPSTVRADKRGEALLREVTQATKKVKSLTATMKGSYRFGGETRTMTGKVSMQRPNLAHIEINAQPTKQLVVSNGKDLYIVLAAQKQYIKQKAMPGGDNIQGGIISGMFFNPDIKAMLMNFTRGSTVSPNLKGTEVRNGVKYQVVEMASNDASKTRVRVYVGPKKLLEGIVLEQSFQGQNVKMEEFLTNVKVNTKLASKLFAYKPPAGYKPYETPAPPSYDAKLLAVGAEAPAFELTKPDDKSKVSLAKMLEGRKAVLVNFWFYGWGACRAEFPHLQKIYDELKDKGLGLIAVNGNDSAEVINKYVNENKFTFTIGMADQKEGGIYDVAEKYGVMAYPTNYLVNAEGKVVWRGVGFDEAAMRKALEQAGLK